MRYAHQISRQTPGDRFYWLCAADGGVFAFGNALFRGSWVQPGSTAA